MINQPVDKQVDMERIELHKEKFFKISNVDELRPFFMSVVSGDNHWLFISSNGGLTAGRRNSSFSLFPYYTDDKITESAEFTGSKTIFRIQTADQNYIWEPLSIRQTSLYNTTRNLYKNVYGNKLVFEEINHDLALSFQYEWNTSNQFGFVRKSRLKNLSNEPLSIELVDGIQNILPAKVGADLQNGTSNLVDAYKRNELIKSVGLGIFALSATIVDRAEPAESLKANIAWSLGLDSAKQLVSSLQLNAFRKGKTIQAEEDVKAEKGAYFLMDTITLAAGAEKKWTIVADVNKNHSAIVELIQQLNDKKQLSQLLEEDIQKGTDKLVHLVATADGLQFSKDSSRDSRHFSNTLFNIMRGGIFLNNYKIPKNDFVHYLKKINQEVAERNASFINNLGKEIDLFDLRAKTTTINDSDLKRIVLEYMPLTFSRRHGDPSRPWNKFDINTQNEHDGSVIYDYQGNWRDIFQNWEALTLSYPAYVESMIHKFLNTSTFDGYNPYRITKNGFDWETVEPDNPWAYIGYWGDHQIIYLLKFLEYIDDYAPNDLLQYFNQSIFVYANVPYKIKTYEDICSNPKDTIQFDFELDEAIRKERKKLGADGALLNNKKNEIHRVNFIEKILATLLSKISNLVPEGGIWLNTQRPEWNDANNALVGNGLSMVTVYYLRRFLSHLEQLLEKSTQENFDVSIEIQSFFEQINKGIKNYKQRSTTTFDDRARKTIVDALGKAGSTFRDAIYTNGFSGEQAKLSVDTLKEFILDTKLCIDHTIAANKRSDNLYHAYNLIQEHTKETLSLSYLDEMLEGQVAVLSAGYLSSSETLEVLNSMKKSALFRPDQYSYILYPNKNLPRFLAKNNLTADDINTSGLLKSLIENEDVSIVEKDIHETYHFNGDFQNANDLTAALDQLDDHLYGDQLAKGRTEVLQTFEKLFEHRKFTGRSGTFFGYEGLGSIYWHMVSKLLLAVQECSLQAIQNNENPAVIGGLLDHYYEINEGIGVHKSPTLYGAFPTDPYSHTPAGRGAQQPGMTGQVKEDILCKFGELGVFLHKRAIVFNPCLLRKTEFLDSEQSFEYLDVNGHIKNLHLPASSLCFTYCQVPIIYKIGTKNEITITTLNDKIHTIDSLNLGSLYSQKIVKRTGEVQLIEVELKQELLK